MDEDKVIVAYHGNWVGCTYKNGTESLIFLPLLKTCFGALIDLVHRIVDADESIYRYVVHCLVSHEDSQVKWRILLTQDLQRAAKMFKTPKFFVTLERRRPTTSPPNNGDKSLSNMKHLMASQGAFGDQIPIGPRFPTSDGRNNHPRPPPYFAPPYFHGSRPSSAPVRPLPPKMLTQHVAKSVAVNQPNKVPKAFAGQTPKKNFWGFDGDVRYCGDHDPVSDGPCRGRSGKGKHNEVSSEENAEENADTTDDEYCKNESWVEVVCKIIYDSFGWEHDDYFIPEDVPESGVVPREEVVIGDIHERVLRSRNISMECTFEEWWPRALSCLLVGETSSGCGWSRCWEEGDKRANPTSSASLKRPCSSSSCEEVVKPSGRSSYSDVIVCSRCWEQGHSRANCTSSVSLHCSSSSFSSDEVAKPRRCGICRDLGHTRRSCPTKTLG